MIDTQLSIQLKPKFNPRPLQLRGLELIVKNAGFRLFLKPGRGKTAVALKGFDILREMGMVDCLLVIAPLRVISTSWPHQINYWQDFDHLKYVTVHGGQQARQKALNTKADVYLMNLEGLIGTEFAPIVKDPEQKRKQYLPNPIAADWFRGKRVMLVVDESTKFKDQNALRCQSLKQYLHMTNRRGILTGTPRPGLLEDLFFQCYITDLGQDLGQFITHFRGQYMQRSADGYGFVELPGAAERVAEKIARTTLLSDPSDEDMPTLEVPVWVPMPEHLKSRYRELKREFLVVLGNSTVMAPNAGVLWGKLRQFAQGAIYTSGSEYLSEFIEVHEAKLDALENILEELNGEPAFCVYPYDHDQLRICARLGYEVPRVGRGVSVAKGAAACRMFSAGHYPLMLGQAQSVAHGIDGLQNNCSNVIWFGGDPSWEVTYQANQRIARSGSKADQVMIYRIMVDCCIERAILSKCRDKAMKESQFLGLLRKSIKEEIM